MPMATPAARLSRTPARVRAPAPGLGEHNALIYGQLALDAAALQMLSDQGII